MTDKASPNERQGGADLARFLQDWSALWREELRAQGNDPESMVAALTGGARFADIAAAMDTWRAAMLAWADALGVRPSPTAATHDQALRSRNPLSRTNTPRTSAAAAAPDPRDAEIERLARRVDDLEARLARLETPRRPRGSQRG